MKILMFGRGVIAVAYGWALERAGHEVEFYVRPGRAAEYGAAIDLELLDARRRLRGAASPRSGRCVTANRWSRTTTST